MSATVRFRDIVKVPRWLGKVGRDFAGVMASPLDTATQILAEGIAARYPGRGTPTALPYIGRSRSLIRNQAETDEAYAARLIAWLDVHPEAGWDERIARVVHEYLSTHPMVRVVDRAGQWTTIAADGTVTRTNAAWDWDSVSHPERNDPDEPWWSDLWVIVYPTPFAGAGPFLGGVTEGSPLWGADDLGIGHDVARKDYFALKGLFAQWKSAHARIRAVIWTTDATLFDPDTPASLPDGEWGAWSDPSTTSPRAPSNRILTTCRYWEPR